MFRRTIIDLADCHTTLHYLHEVPPAEVPLNIGTNESYQDLYHQLAAHRRLDYEQAGTGRAGIILKRLQPGYSRDRFWHRYLGSGNYESYPNLAWDNLLPIEASFSIRVRCLAEAQCGCEISPIPRVLLFPFGWSTWISLLITGDHSLDSLSSFVQCIFRDRVFEVSNSVSPVTLRRLFSLLSEGIRTDAFGGTETADASTPDTLIVTTVLAKRQGSLSCWAFLPEEQEMLRRTVRPTGPRTSDPFDSQVRPLDGGHGELNFLFMDTFGRFIWSQRLLASEGRNPRHLRCYHNNTFRSFVLAWHQFSLLREVVQRQPVLTPDVRHLVDRAIFKLSWPPYRSGSLLAFLDESIVAGTLEAAKRFLGRA